MAELRRKLINYHMQLLFNEPEMFADFEKKEILLVRQLRDQALRVELKLNRELECEDAGSKRWNSTRAQSVRYPSVKKKGIGLDAE